MTAQRRPLRDQTVCEVVDARYQLAVNGARRSAEVQQTTAMYAAIQVLQLGRMKHTSRCIGRSKPITSDGWSKTKLY